MKLFEKYYKWIVAFIFCVAVIAVYKTFDNISHITKAIGTVLGAFKPFVIGFVIAYLLNMPAKRIEALVLKVKNGKIRKRAHAISILSVYILGVIALVLILWALIPALYRNIIDLYNNFPSYITRLQTWINNRDIFQNLKLFGDDGLDLESKLKSTFGSIDMDKFMDQFGKYAQGVFDITSRLFDSFIAIISSIYMLADKNRLQKSVHRMMDIIWKPKTVDKIVGYAKRINDIFTNYIYSRLMCSLVMAVVCGIVLTIMNVRYALILGLFIGAMDMIPYFGSIIACVVSIAVTIITGGICKAVWTGVILLVLQQIDGNVLGPRIMGNSLEISPLLIILAVSVGGTLFGFLGMLISVPVAAMISAVVNDYVKAIEAKKER